MISSLVETATPFADNRRRGRRGDGPAGANGGAIGPGRGTGTDEISVDRERTGLGNPSLPVSRGTACLESPLHQSPPPQDVPDHTGVHSLSGVGRHPATGPAGNKRVYPQAQINWSCQNSRPIFKRFL